MKLCAIMKLILIFVEEDMAEPRLRNVKKAVPPYPINQFPSSFIECFAEDIVYLLATKSTMLLEGNEWEQIFANCIRA